MLIRNYSYVNQICGHNHSGVTNPFFYISPHTMRGYYVKFQYEDEGTYNSIKRDSFPTGTNPPYSIILGNKGASLSSTTTIKGESEVVTNLSMGKGCDAALSGMGIITNSNLSLIVQLASSLSGNGTITVANLVGVVALASSFYGTGNLTAGLNLIAYINSILSGTSTATANLRGTLSMSAAIYVNQSEADVQQLVDGVWNALTANYNSPGSMGYALNAAGTAGDPWLTSLPGSYGAGTAGNIIGNMSASAIADAVLDEILSGHTIPGSLADELRKRLKTTDFIALK